MEGVEIRLTGIGRMIQTVTPAGGKKTERVVYHQGDPEFDSYDPTLPAEMQWLRSIGREDKIPKNFMGPETISSYNGPMLSQQVYTVLEQYHRGTADEKAVEDTMAQIIAIARSTYTEKGFDPAEFTPQLIQDVYNIARLGNIHGTMNASYYDSLPIATTHNGHSQNTHDWIYYDAKYYYASEEMKGTLQDIARRIGEKYGVPADSLDLPTTYPDGDIRKGIYSSYNTIINDHARNEKYEGNMIDETMVPPRGLRFFYKGNSTGQDLIVPTLPAAQGSEATIFDGSLHVWYGDWSFLGRVPIGQSGPQAPVSVNMFDVVSQNATGGVPPEITDFLRNFDFFSPYQYGSYRSAHPRRF